VQKLALDLFAALHFLHANRVLHRDVKPQNILLDGEGKNGEIELMMESLS